MQLPLRLLAILPAVWLIDRFDVAVTAGRVLYAVAMAARAALIAAAATPPPDTCSLVALR
jgi:hypothetical protein